MAVKGSAGKVKMSSFEDLFGDISQNNKSVNAMAEARELPLQELHTFKNHPFLVMDDEKMEELTESIRERGVLIPVIVRPRKEGGYEIIAGHRRKRASELAGKKTIPVVVRDYTDDEAVVVMVDSNIQRENILPSEKARAYRMKFEARKHQGSKDGKHTLDEIGETAGESGKTVQRYIRLSHLTDELLELVDAKTVGIVQGTNISYLSVEQQQMILNILSDNEMRAIIGVEQSVQLKELSRSGALSKELAEKILYGKQSVKQSATIRFSRIRTYFPEEYSGEQMEAVICTLLEKWKSELEHEDTVSKTGSEKL